MTAIKNQRMTLPVVRALITKLSASTVNRSNVTQGSSAAAQARSTQLADAAATLVELIQSIISKDEWSDSIAQECAQINECIAALLMLQCIDLIKPYLSTLITFIWLQRQHVHLSDDMVDTVVITRHDELSSLLLSVLCQLRQFDSLFAGQVQACIHCPSYIQPRALHTLFRPLQPSQELLVLIKSQSLDSTIEYSSLRAALQSIPPSKVHSIWSTYLKQLKSLPELTSNAKSIVAQDFAQFATSVPVRSENAQQIQTLIDDSLSQLSEPSLARLKGTVIDDSLAHAVADALVIFNALVAVRGECLQFEKQLTVTDRLDRLQSFQVHSLSVPQLVDSCKNAMKNGHLWLAVNELAIDRLQAIDAHLKSCILAFNDVEQRLQQEAVTLARFVCDSLSKCELDLSTSFDIETRNIDTPRQRQCASFYQITSHLHTIARYADLQSLHQISECIVHCRIAPSITASAASVVTMQSSTRDLLNRPQIYECATMREPLIQSCLKHVAACIDLIANTCDEASSNAVKYATQTLIDCKEKQDMSTLCDAAIDALSSPATDGKKSKSKSSRKSKSVSATLSAVDSVRLESLLSFLVSLPSGYLPASSKTAVWSAACLLIALFDRLQLNQCIDKTQLILAQCVHESAFTPSIKCLKWLINRSDSESLTAVWRSVIESTVRALLPQSTRTEASARLQQYSALLDSASTTHLQLLIESSKVCYAFVKREHDASKHLAALSQRQQRFHVPVACSDLLVQAHSVLHSTVLPHVRNVEFNAIASNADKCLTTQHQQASLAAALMAHLTAFELLQTSPHLQLDSRIESTDSDCMSTLRQITPLLLFNDYASITSSDAVIDMQINAASLLHCICSHIHRMPAVDRFADVIGLLLTVRMKHYTLSFAPQHEKFTHALTQCLVALLSHTTNTQTIDTVHSLLVHVTQSTDSLHIAFALQCIDDCVVHALTVRRRALPHATVQLLLQIVANVSQLDVHEHRLTLVFCSLLSHIASRPQLMILDDSDVALMLHSTLSVANRLLSQAESSQSIDASLTVEQFDALHSILFALLSHRCDGGVQSCLPVVCKLIRTSMRSALSFKSFDATQLHHVLTSLYRAVDAVSSQTPLVRHRLRKYLIYTLHDCIILQDQFLSSSTSSQSHAVMVKSIMTQLMATLLAVLSEHEVSHVFATIQPTQRIQLKSVQQNYERNLKFTGHV